MIKQIFLFSNVKFFSDAISNALKNQGVETFVIDEDQELEYFIQDMVPQAFLIDWEGFNRPEKIIDRYNKLALKLPMFVLGSEGPFQEGLHFIKKPIDPFYLYEQVSRVLEE